MKHVDSLLCCRIQDYKLSHRFQVVFTCSQLTNICVRSFSENDSLTGFFSGSCFSEKDESIIKVCFKNWKQHGFTVPDCKNCKARFKCWTGNIDYG